MNNNKLHTYLILIVLLFAKCASANSTSFNLWDVYTLALKHNEDFNIAKYNTSIQEQQNRQVFSQLLPNIRLSRSHTHEVLNYGSGGGTSAAFLNSDVRSKQSIISLSQPVFNYANILSNRKTEYTTKVTDLRYYQSVQDSIYSTINAYFQVLNNKIELEQISIHLEFIKQNLNGIKKKYNFHQATKVDLTEADSSYQSTQLEVFRIKNSLSSDKLKLANYIGLDNTDYEIQLPQYRQLTKLDINDDWNYWLGVAKQNSYDVRISQSSSDSSDKDVEIATAGHLPTVDFSASYADSSDNRLIGDEHTDRIYRLELSIPIFQGLLTDARISEAEHRQEQSRLSLKKAHKSLVQDLRIAYDNMLFLKQRIKTLQLLVDVNKLKFDTTKSGLLVGLRTNLELLLASKELHDSKKDRKQATHNYILSYFRLKTIAGVLSESDIKLLNEILFN